MTKIFDSLIKRHIKTWITILVIFTLGSYVYWWAFLKREYHQWSETIVLWDGRHLKIQKCTSQKAYHGTPNHLNPFWWGGGDPWDIVQFTVDDKEYRWEGPYIPIAVQPDKDAVYIVVFDRETPGDCRFRLYRNITTATWLEITPKDFPRHLAIQNTWLRTNNGIRMDGTVVNEYDIVAKMDPGSYDFCGSLTAKLWDYLENPDFDYNDSLLEGFLREYKTKWIRAADDNQLK
jgi:hypothetical protein